MVDRSDRHHRRVTRFLDDYSGQLLTTWPVLAEACHFMPARAQVRLLRWAAAGGPKIAELPDSALAVIADGKEKYRNLPMDLADASLLWVADQTGVCDILTIDLRDFNAYRLLGGKALTPVL